MNEETLFHKARHKPASERSEFLDEACGGDLALRRRIEILLQADDNPDSLLELRQPATSAISPLSEAPGQMIGPYKLLEQIGEGGMGVVFMAEQQEPVRRKVALKVIKPGMDTRQVIARFEAERQALAVMDHPSIARVLDAGATDSGRPYFVMELVRGVPITTFCDENNLSIRERLELFAAVCQAIQHAHTKGIIHRDIKPTNVLVTRQDGRPAVKVIDFGVAKAMGQQLTEKTLFTNFTQMIGTPLYMSPEQAEQSGVDIDTRSDIYSLGVLLYELLTGSTPVDKEQMKQAAFDEVRRIIREDEPQTPSARISGSRTLPAIAAYRHIEPARLSKLVRGELDWIVMKALEKNRSRRYETANAFAADVLRYLVGEAVHACPPSAVYRFRKLASRHKGAIAAAAALTAVLVVATAFSTWQALRATRALQAETAARREAEAARQQSKTEAATAQAINDFLNQDLLGQANPLLAYDRFKDPTAELKLLTVLDRATEKLEGRFVDQPLVEAALRQTIGVTYNRLGNNEKAASNLQRAIDLRRAHLGADHPDTLTSMADLAGNRNDTDLTARVLEARRRVLGMDHRDTLVTMFRLAMQFREKGEITRAAALFRETLEAQRRVLGKDDPQTAFTMYVLAHTLFANANTAGIETLEDHEIESMYRHALAVQRKVHGNIWHTYDITARLGEFLSSRHRYEEAESVLQDAVIQLQSLPGASPDKAAELANVLDGVYQSWGKPERAAEWKRSRAAPKTQPR